ncbi:MAG: V-type ATPase subunit [Bacillota bacterium]
MRGKSYPFACASIKVRETKLLTKEKLLRIKEAGSAEDAFKLLSEIGYGSGECHQAVLFESLIKRELKDAYDYISRIVPDQNAFNLFLYKNDYLNLKILLKRYAKKEPLSSGALKKNGTIPLEILKSAVADKQYGALPAEMKEALISLDRQFSVKEDVSLIGVFLDSAYARQLQRAVKGVRDGFIKDYMAAYADITNVISFIRLRLLNMGKETLKKVFIEGGAFEEKAFFEAFESGLDSISHYFAKRGFERSLNAAFDEFKKSGSLYAFEKARDDYLIDIIMKHKDDVFTIGPSVAYILAKEREADNIRIVMTAKLNGKDAEFLGGRIKGMYA